MAVAGTPQRWMASAVPRVATIRKPRSCSDLGDRAGRRLVGVGHGDEGRALGRQRRAGRGLGLGERAGEVARDAHDLAGRAHLRAEDGVRALEAVERQDRLLDADVVQRRVLGGQVEVGELLAEHQPAGHLGQRHADRLGDERDGPRRARVGLDHVQLAGVDGVLHVAEADDAEAERDPARGRADLVEHVGPERVRRQHAGAVTGVDPRLLDVLHDPADPDRLPVTQRVDVDLDRVLQEAVQEDVAPVAGVAGEVVGEAVARVDDLHRPAAKDIGRAHEQRIADALPASSAPSIDARRRLRRRLVAQALQQLAEAAALLGEVDRVHARPEDGDAGLLQSVRELQRGLAPELDDDADRASRSR